MPHVRALPATIGFVLAAFLIGQLGQATRGEAAGTVTDEVVHARSHDGITNGGAVFTPPPGAAKPIAVIWVHGNGVNFYYPTYVKIARELAGLGVTTITANTRMHDLGTIAAFRGDARIRGGSYWGVPSEQVRDLAAWIDFANDRGFKRIVLVGHSAGAPAVQSYQARTQDPRVVGLVLASGRVQPGTPPDKQRVDQARRLVAEGLGEALLPNPNRPTSFVSAATFLDLANMGQELTDFFGVQTPDPPVARIRCPILAWFGTDETDIGTASDLELLKSTLKHLPTGPSRVDTVMLRNADHMYSGAELQVAQTISTWADTLMAAKDVR
jgi:pimeloyl-ACP methyl ester carboxylesterase